MIKLRNTTNQEVILMETLLRESGQEDDTYQIPMLKVPAWVMMTRSYRPSRTAPSS